MMIILTTLYTRNIWVGRWIYDAVIADTYCQVEKIVCCAVLNAITLFTQLNAIEKNSFLSAI